MGQTLSEPVTRKETSSDENHTLKIGASCMQGWRINMEDEHTHSLCLNDEKESHMFAVFDGHGGQAAAQFASKKICNAVVSHHAYQKGDIAVALREGFLQLDDEMMRDPAIKDDMSGCTAVSILIKGGKIYCGNIGDSRAISSVRGHVQQLSFDHKPNHSRELQRITAAGGWVEFNRVNGNLALSRAFGDFSFKKNLDKKPEEQVVTAYPDVIVKDLTPDHEFLVLACDGIWDVLSNEDVVDFVREKLATRMQPEMICEHLLTRCLANDCSAGGIGCDNMTVMIIVFKQSGSFEKTCEKCAVPKRDPIPPSCLLSSYPDFVQGNL
ncbi:putative protein phosphatase 2C T23F11.1 [Styela clava]